MLSNRGSIISILEGFGLSEYEARVYVSLLEHDTLLASELAYYSGVPRTKVYSSIRKLEKKGLLKTISTKPVKCRAIAPEDCLEAAVSVEEMRVKKMKKAVQGLQKLREEARRKALVQERQYFIVGPQGISTKLRELIGETKLSMSCVVDGWGMRTTEQCGEALLTALTNGVDVKVVTTSYLDLTNRDTRLPGAVRIRLGKAQPNRNVFIFDEDHILAMSSASGTGVIISSKDLALMLKETLFQNAWENSVPVKNLSKLAGLSRSEEVIDLLDVEKANRAFVKGVSATVRTESELAGIGEKFIEELDRLIGTEIFRRPLEVALPVLLTLLLHGLGDEAIVRFDPVTRLLTIEAPESGVGVPPSVWLFAIAGFLSRMNTPMKIIQNSGTGTGHHILQLKIYAPVLKNQ